MTHKFTDKFTYTLDASFSHIDHVPNLGSTNWYGFVNYLQYTFTDKLVGTLRIEEFDDRDGFRTGTRGLYTESTVGVAYTPIPAVVLRPFFRYDYNHNGAFEGKNSLYTGGIEAIFRY